MRYAIVMILLMILLGGLSCAGRNVPKDREASEQALEKIEASDFPYTLFNKSVEDDNNLFFSPYSISTALSMAWVGAENNTALQMAALLGYSLPKDEQIKLIRQSQSILNDLGKNGKATLTVANALFDARRYEHLLMPKFKKSIRENFQAEMFSLDFDDAVGSADFVNSWVEQKTAKRIKNLITPDHIRGSNDGMVLVNAIYFNGMWKKKFNPDFTMEDRFYTVSNPGDKSHSKNVMMMHARDIYPHAKVPGYQILELPYEEGELSMMIILPDDIAKAEKELSATLVKSWQKELKERELKIFIPKFKLDTALPNLSKTLKELGMTDAFNSKSADFSGIRNPQGGPGLYIMDVIHKAFVEVKEEGTEAAAATGIVMATKSAATPPPEVPVFRADRPFIYMIMHKASNTPLFMGKFCDPPKLP